MIYIPRPKNWKRDIYICQILRGSKIYLDLKLGVVKTVVEDLVSVVIPVYNAEKFLADTLETVLNQTYSNWELLLIDDCSKDNSVEIIRQYASKDARIKLFRQNQNGGSALARNKGIKEAKGRFICFLDADDKWINDKLKNQVEFMMLNKCEFSFTAYQFANENCIPNGAIVKVPKTVNYKQALKNTTISTITVMFDMNNISKKEIYMPNIKSEDTATWWKILRTGRTAYGIQGVMSYYRRTANSLSANKIEAIKRIWNLYRNVENLNILFSAYNFVFWAFNAVKRRI